jgi:thiamine biosynthesis protein ThiI
MTNESVILIHYGELSLKGRNRNLFEIKLKENIERASGGKVRMFRGRFVLKGGTAEPLSKVFGIAWFAEAVRTDRDIHSITDTVLSLLKAQIKDKESFGVFVRRSDKGFPLNSMQVGDKLGREISACYGLKVDLSNPDLRVHIEIAEEAYVYFERTEGRRGLPLGISGKVLSLVSGGIDSPVSSYLMMKRGCEVEFVHFHVFSENTAVSNTKMNSIFRIFGGYQPGSRIHHVPYYVFETALLGAMDTKGYELVLFRRLMVRVAERIAHTNGCQALVTGDSLGQVASQTLENIIHLKNSVSIPIFQPLLAYDKQEIIDTAKEIGTYEASIKPYKDCCSIVTKKPRTKAQEHRIKCLEDEICIDSVVEETLKFESVVEY